MKLSELVGEILSEKKPEDSMYEVILYDIRTGDEIRHEKNLSAFQADEIYNQLIQTHPVMQKIQNVKIKQEKK